LPEVAALDDLNPPQRQAVTTLDGPLLVLAGAGSGKTRVITHRVAYLLDHGVAPDHVLAVSFTNKAADEMRERVRRLVGAKPAQRLTLSTFHALGLQLLKSEKAALGFRTGFTVYDGADQLGVVRECLRAVRVDDRRYDAKAILHRISRAKNAFLLPEDLVASQQNRRRARNSDDDYDLITEEIYPRYQAAMRSFHALDFDDLIVETVRLLDGDEAVRAKWQKRFRYVMVDEYQDTNRSQLLLVRHLVALHNNLCVVGDDDQSIYAWRGAESGNILEFERHFPGARRITLDQNYRSTTVILDAANAVIAHNTRRHPKKLFTAQPGGERIQLVVADNPEEEARFVAGEIEVLRERGGVRAGECAILYRSNIQSRPFEEALRQARLDYRMIGGQAFYERKEVKDAIAYLKAALQPRDEIALRRIVNYPARGVGDTTLERCAAHAALHKSTLWEALCAAGSIEELTTRSQEAIAGFVGLLDRHRPALAGETPLPLAEAARRLVDETGIRDDLRAAGPTPLAAQRRLENVEGFLRAVENWEQRTRTIDARKAPSLADYLHRLTLVATEDDAGETADAGRVTLVTLHGAKGLEFRVVFLVGLEEELLPHRRTLNPIATDVADDAGDAVDLSEERRLLYVGITRAREQLFLSRCRRRGGRGESGSRGGDKPRAPSRFLDEIPEELCQARDVAAPPALDPADEEAFARECLARLRALADD
jgi:DNA helicase-2/ATP-dependent DNA helicase PcrA